MKKYICTEVCSMQRNSPFCSRLQGMQVYYVPRPFHIHEDNALLWPACCALWSRLYWHHYIQSTLRRIDSLYRSSQSNLLLRWNWNQFSPLSDKTLAVSFENSADGRKKSKESHDQCICKCNRHYQVTSPANWKGFAPKMFRRSADGLAACWVPRGA